MSNYDGVAEAEAIITRLRSLVGGRVLDGLPDDDEIPRFPDGKVRPYIVALFSEPIPTWHDRGIGSDSTQPYILPVSIIAVAGDSTTARRIQASVTNLLIDWAPSATSDTMKPGRGRQYVTTATESKPTRYERIRWFEVRINL